MSDEIAPEITDPLSRSINLPISPERFELCREAVRRADEVGNEHFRFIARLWLIQAAGEQGYPEVQLVELAWCMGAHLRNPEKHSSSQFIHLLNGGVQIFGS